MSIRKVHVKNLEDLKLELTLHGHNAFYEKYVKYDVLMGKVESVDFINSILDKGIKKEKIKK
tara:strand:+ start:1661 stop:1846 length:186 start_codon:yes stop_codon:yes gene_type:complete